MNNQFRSMAVKALLVRIFGVIKYLQWHVFNMLYICLLVSTPVIAEIGIPEVIKAPITLQPVLSDKDSGLRYPATIKFDNPDAHEIVKVVGASGVAYKNDGMHFITTKASGFLWGRQLGDKRADFEEKFCSGWKDDSSRWVIQVKLKQQLKKSDWQLDVYSFIHGKETTKTLKRTLTGTSENVLQFDMGLCKRVSFGVRLRTKTAGNQVVISWVRVRKLSLPQYFRYSFYLDNVVSEGKVYWAAGGGSELYVNGVLVSSVRGQGPLWRKLNSASIGQYLTQGKNVIAVKTDGYTTGGPFRRKGGSFFFLRGGIIMADGDIIPILTSKQWVVSTKDEKNWMDTEFSDDQFLPAASMGLANNHRIGGQEFDQWAGFNRFPYIGSLKITPYKRELPFFLSHENVRFSLQLKNHKQSSKDSIQYSVLDASNNTIVINKEFLVSQLRINNGVAIIDIPILASGAYVLNLEYSADGMVQKRRIEFVKTGKIKQEKTSSTTIETDLKTELVDEVLFTSAINNEINYGRGGRKGRASVSKNNASKPGFVEINGIEFVETGVSVNDWLSVKFSIKDLYKPHLVKIDIPNNAKRNMTYIIAEGSGDTAYRNMEIGSGFIRASSGLYTVAPVGNNASNKIITEYMVFWPNKFDQTFTLINAGGRKESPAAISKLTVYQLAETLPEFDTGIDSAGSFIGPFVERIDRSLASTFYSGPLAETFPYQYVDGGVDGYYNAWYVTIKNLITYLKFSGQNTFYAGIYMYNGGWLTEPRFQGRAETGRKNLPAGWREDIIKLMAKMFEENDLKLVLSVQFISSPILIAKGDLTDFEMQQGGKSLRFVSRWGNQVYGFQNGGFNFLSEEVKHEALELADYIAKEYSSFPSVRGVMWHRLPEFPYGRGDRKIKSSLDVGYGDTTVKLFEHDCACKVPVDLNDPKRFAKRYMYLTTEVRDQWIKWRSKKVWELNKELSARLKVKRPNWKFIVFRGRPGHGGLMKWEHESGDLDAFLLEDGIDPDLYVNDDTLSLMLTYDFLGQRKFERQYKTRDVSEAIASMNLKLLDEGMSVTDGWFFHIGFMIESLVLTKENWPWRKIKFIGYSAPETNTLSKKVKALVYKNNPGLYVTGWIDTGFFVGRESVWRNLSLQLH